MHCIQIPGTRDKQKSAVAFILVEARERAFPFAVLRLWHSVPKQAYLVPTLLDFHPVMKIELFKQAFLSSSCTNFIATRIVTGSLDSCAIVTEVFI